MRFIPHARRTKKQPSSRNRGAAAVRTHQPNWLISAAFVLIVMGCKPADDAPPNNTTAQIPSPPRVKTMPHVVTPPAPSAQLATQTLRRSATVAKATPWNDGNLPVALPIVRMTDHHRNQCRVFVDDHFPDLTVSKPDQSSVTLHSQIQHRLAVVLFWNRKHKVSVEAVRRLEQVVLAPFKDLAFVAVHVGEDDAAIEQIENSMSPTARQIHLRASSDQMEAEFGEGLFPRTYLVRADGTIAWLDVDYGRSTRRDLRNAIRYLQQDVSSVAATHVTPAH